MVTEQSRIIMEKAVIASNIWVGNKKLISILWRELLRSGQLDQIDTPECIATTLEDGSLQQINSPTITFETLQALVESRLWDNNLDILWFIFNNFANLPLSQARRQQFGSTKFWDALFGSDLNDNQFGVDEMPDSNFYQIGKLSHLRVR